jgi:serine/threonine protein kinase/ABC-type branched-subunit amino acid transport system substrate-binding protein
MSNRQEPRLRQQISEYRLLSKLGAGGFGTVYLAEHVHERTQVAVKVLDIRLTKAGDFKDFINEVRTILLRHDHIVPLLDFGISRDDLPFLVMEYAPEGTLRDRHPKGDRIPLVTIVSYVDQLASALQYAHDRRVIHRDVKPENILVRADGTLMVSDFGIAKLMEQSVLSIQTQVGTPLYMAPEQHLGYPSFASDQYALAVVIYEWITGVRPFQGTAVGLAVQHMHTPPLPLRHHHPTLPEVVERVILKALAKKPAERFESIQKFADALRGTVPPPLAPNLSIKTRETDPLILPEQESQPASEPKSDALVGTPNDTDAVSPVHTPTDADAVSPEPALQTANVPISALPVQEEPQEDTQVSVLRNTALLPASTPDLSQSTIPKSEHQKTIPDPTRKSPLWIRILIVATIFCLVLSVGITAFFTAHQGKDTTSGSNATGIGIINKPNNEHIGISDGTYAFDISPDRVDASLKIDAAKMLAQNDKTGAISHWNRAVGKAGNDTSDAEALIYLEDQRVLASGSPYITIVVGTMLTGDESNIGPGRRDIQGAYVAQKEYNDGRKLSGGRLVRLLIANAGSKSAYVTQVAEQIVQAAKHDPTIVGVMGWSRSGYAQAAIPVLARAHIPIISSTASADNLSGISPYFFRVVSSNKSQAIAGAKYAEQQLHASRVALFVDPKNSYSNSLATDFSKQFVADGNQIVDTENYTIGDKASLPGHLQEASKFDPDLIYFSGYADDLAVLLVDLSTFLPDLQVLGGATLYAPNGYPSSAQPGFSHLHFTAFAYPDEWSILTGNRPQPFFTEYSAAFNPAGADHHTNPYGFIRADDSVILSYDAMHALLQGCQNVLDVHGPLTPDALRNGLAQISGARAIQGVSGQISFGNNGDPVNKAVIILYVDPEGHIHMLENDGVQGCFMLGECG